MRNVPVPTLAVGHQIIGQLTQTTLPPAQEAALLVDLADFLEQRYTGLPAAADVASDLRVRADRIQRHLGGVL